MNLTSAVKLLPTFVETFRIFGLFIYLVPSIDSIHFEIYVESNLQSIETCDKNEMYCFEIFR